MATPVDKNIDKVIYEKLASPKKLEFAKEKKPKVKKEDYDAGHFTRYFLRQVNNRSAKIIEVDKGQFNKFKSEPFYINLELMWKITGTAQEISNTNFNIVSAADKQMPGIKEALQNKLLDFAKLS